MSTLNVGDKAPEFSLPDQNGTVHSLAQNKGKWVLLYFYPKDMTPGCTVEACELRDAWQDFAKVNAVVFGVSADSVKSHKKFEEKHSLPFPILSDEDKTVINAYGAWGKKKFMGREYEGIYRWSFLINPTGMIEKIYKDVKPKEHAREVLKDLHAGV
ncbi:MAG: thioredoxin-dependent thiol peroxidase [Patescibacteria group bacterium]|jgi:peroxiredoxin Q/BCP